ncbi:tail fiber protein / tail tubular protein A [Enterobacter phage IME278]|uniref:Tail fiber protein / tail tubular protein A n=1 Tax=Enterobacter phage IME278 TaxID=2829366 RepID=A0A8T8JG54_9CAUD|nr:tail fiber protein / tail tubular protein A [Enterobacter phage IME278]
MAEYVPLNTDEYLDAVNDMLGAIGEPALLSLDDGNADASNAQRILTRVNRQVQAKGWNFNINGAAVLTPDLQTNTIRYLPTYLRVMTEGAASTYSNMGGVLYDMSTQSTTFTAAITVELVELKPFSEMPSVFRDYIVTKASREFNAKFFGSPESEAYLREQEAELYQQVMEYEMDTGRYNMMDSIGRD